MSCCRVVVVPQATLYTILSICMWRDLTCSSRNPFTIVSGCRRLKETKYARPMHEASSLWRSFRSNKNPYWMSRRAMHPMRTASSSSQDSLSSLTFASYNEIVCTFSTLYPCFVPWRLDRADRNRNRSRRTKPFRNLQER